MKKLSLICFLLVAFISNAQDIHFSQFYMNPIQLNPSLTGNFNGDWRLTANQKSQWRSVSRPYNTFALSAENKEGLLLPNLFHAINMYHDATGDGNLRTIEMNLSTAYKYYLTADSTHSLTTGFQIGFNRKSIDFSKLNFDEQYDGYYFNQNLPITESFVLENYTNLNLAVGLIHTYAQSKRKFVTSGIGVFNLTQPKQSFYDVESIKRDPRLVLHSKANFPLNYEIDIQPGLFLQFQSTYKEIVFGSNVKYIYKNRNGEYIAPYAGLWFRNKDALNTVIGVYYNNWIAGMSYDINLSKLLPASKVRGGLEFSVQYIIHLFKPLDIKHRVCPDYI